jgi:hypothetical protein
VRVPCASSATLGNSTERVNGRLALERRSDAAKPYRDARRELVASRFSFYFLLAL